jgi:hypothetical protein
MPDSVDYLVCPECRGEHVLTATHCASCRVALVAPEEVAATDVAIADLPPASELDCLRVAPLPWVRALSQTLEQVGIVHRVERAREEDAPDGQDATVFDGAQLFGLYVRSVDAARARELDGAIAVQLLAGEAPPLAEGEQEDCPACGTALAADDVECGECGLQFA